MRGLFSPGHGEESLRVLYLYAFIPFVVFTLSRAKWVHTPPVFGVATIIAVVLLHNRIRVGWANRYYHFFSSAPPWLLPVSHTGLAPVQPYLAGASIATLLACILLSRRYMNRFLAAGSIFLMGISIPAICLPTEDGNEGLCA
jgi:hypothetical protein